MVSGVDKMFSKYFGVIKVLIYFYLVFDIVIRAVFKTLYFYVVVLNK